MIVVQGKRRRDPQAGHYVWIVCARGVGSCCGDGQTERGLLPFTGSRQQVALKEVHDAFVHHGQLDRPIEARWISQHIAQQVVAQRRQG